MLIPALAALSLINKTELGDPKVQIFQIGPAGEQMVRYACLISMCSRDAGRTGMGAVMGSKNLRSPSGEYDAGF